MDLGIVGRRALVTGASSGLGLSTARALAAEGVSVMLVSRDADRLAEAAATVTPAHGASVHVHAADVSDPSAVSTMVRSAHDALGGIDILIANAGGPPPGTFASTPFDAYEAALKLNLLSTVAMCREVVPIMKENGWGRIVAITSTSVREPIEHLILSNTARAGLTGFLKTLAREVAGHGITVNTVQPGLHLTGRLAALYPDPAALASTIPAGMVGDPDDFGHVTAFVCSEHARFMTGVSLPLDGGALRGLQ
ncbi:MAG: SDR family oxidoreductase [Acidimicrobiia bacterium]|nr:SDR family oxidoreductase [Acidimicrobiia bacterium]